MADLDIREYFAGELAGWGVIRNWRGRLALRFDMEMSGRIEGGILVMDELIRYDNGTEQRREWRITHSDDRRFTGTAADVVGEARGVQEGSTATLRYAIRIPAGGREVVVKADDRLFLLDGGRMINASVFRKFGIKVGSLEATFVKKPA